MDTFELLHHVGLPKKEAAVYSALLEGGQQSISELNRSTHINRPALYEIIPRLIKKNLVSKVKHKNRYQYAAESPRELAAQYKDEYQDISKRLGVLSEDFSQPSATKPVIKYFEGEHGMRFVFDDVAHTLPPNSEFYRYSAWTRNHKDTFKNTFYVHERDRKKLERLVITSEKKASAKKPKLERSVRAIPKEFDLFEDNVSMVIYGNKTAYIDYEAKAAFIVESEKIARFQEKLFKLLWKKLDIGRAHV